MVDGKMRTSSASSFRLPPTAGSKVVPHPVSAGLKRVSSMASTVTSSTVSPTHHSSSSQIISDSRQRRIARLAITNSPAIKAALTHVKSFMTDNQKSLVMLREARILFEAGDYQSSLGCCCEGISFCPSVSLFSLRAACYKAQDNYTDAYYDYSYCIRFEPTNGSHYCARGICLAKMRKLQLAVEDLTFAIQFDATALHYYTRGCIHADFGKFELSIYDFTQCLDEILPATGELRVKARYRRALSNFDIRKYEDAVADCKAVLLADPNHVPARALLGRAYKARNEFTAAEEQLLLCLEMDKTQPTIYAELGDIRFRTTISEKVIEAVYSFEEAIRLLNAKLEAQQSYGARPLLGVVGNQLANASIAARNEVAYALGVTTKEIEEQLADCYFRLAQAKLLVDTEFLGVNQALEDALRAMEYAPEDDDYVLVTSTCLLRLGRYHEAEQLLREVLRRSPGNEKALYNLSFCRRACGDQKVAIDGLTQIIASSESFSGSESAAIPMHRVYEMRGTLLHEVQAHRLSLADLGRAIALNPSHSGNYFLRADCHCRLGNYEQALEDYKCAEQRAFPDTTALLLARGWVLRLLNRPAEAIADFDNAVANMDETDRLSRVRALSFSAFCKIDCHQYSEALATLKSALVVNDVLVALAIETIQYGEGDGNPLSDEAEHRANSDRVYAMRSGWVLRYHMALCFYMQQRSADCREVLIDCLSQEQLPYVADETAHGTVLFFLALTHLRLSDPVSAEECLQRCQKSHYIDTSRNHFLVLYARAKACQCIGNHKQAVALFTESMTLSGEDLAYCHFRRAWSHKALGDFVAAGDDFETAKTLQPEDPNFAVDYKRIARCEYMEIASEPDLIAPFPALLAMNAFR